MREETDPYPWPVFAFLIAGGYTAKRLLRLWTVCLRKERLFQSKKGDNRGSWICTG